MGVPSSYLGSIKNTASIFEAIQRAGVPEKFSYEFLKNLGFTSSSDRPIIPLLKAIGFLDDGSTPTERYRQYKDRSIAKAVMAQGLREGYANVFAVDRDAHRKSPGELTGIFGRLSDKSESVTAKMATTFSALCALANFDDVGPAAIAHEPVHEVEDATVMPAPPAGPRGGSVLLRHDVHVHLPLSTGVAVYDAIFRSLKANLL